MPCNFWVMVHKLIQSGSYARRTGFNWRISYDDEKGCMVYETQHGKKPRAYFPSGFDIGATDWYTE